MNILWGSLMAVIGLLLLLGGITKSRVVIYRMLVARSRMQWGEGDSVHYFYQVVGLMLLVLGTLWVIGVIWN